MRLTDIPNPSETAKPLLTSIDPWQRDALRKIGATYGMDEDACIRAGLTIFLNIVAASGPLSDAGIIARLEGIERRVGRLEEEKRRE